MKKIVNRITILSMTLMFASGIAVAQMGGGMAPPAPPEEQAGVYRNAVFHAISYKFGVMNGMVQGNREVDDAHFEQSAKDLEALSLMLEEGFDNGSSDYMGLTTSAVWDDHEEFKELLGEFKVKAATLAAGASAGVEASNDAFVDLRSTCGGCHRTYRERVGG